MSTRVLSYAMIVVLACAVGAFLAAPARASGRAGNAAATRAYLRAEEAYERSAHAAVGMAAAAIGARAAAIGRECPSALTYAPRDAEFGELGAEAILTAILAGIAPERTAMLRLAQTTGRLSWSSHMLTALVRAEAAKERALATLALPDVCADIAAWKASAYAALPKSAAKFLVRAESLVEAAKFLVRTESFIESLEQSHPAAVTRLLKPYERPPDRRIVGEIERLEARNRKRLETVTTAARKKLAQALGVSAL